MIEGSLLILLHLLPQAFSQRDDLFFPQSFELIQALLVSYKIPRHVAADEGISSSYFLNSVLPSRSKPYRKKAPAITATSMDQLCTGHERSSTHALRKLSRQDLERTMMPVVPPSCRVQRGPAKHSSMRKLE